MQIAARMLLLAVTMLSAQVTRAGESRPRHPEPRVIVNVLSVRGPHDRDGIERSARLGWGRIVRCYRASGAAKVVLTFELVVSGSGMVERARRTHSSTRDHELGHCLASALTKLTMPKARARSIAMIEIRLAPGDPPEQGDVERDDWTER